MQWKTYFYMFKQINWMLIFSLKDQRKLLSERTLLRPILHPLCCFCLSWWNSLLRHSHLAASSSSSSHSSAISYRVLACWAPGSDGNENGALSFCWRFFQAFFFPMRLWFCWNVINPSEDHSWGCIPSSTHQPADGKHYHSRLDYKNKSVSPCV